MRSHCFATLLVFQFMLSAAVYADAPAAKYIFPAGGRRGTTVPVRIGGCNFHDRAQFHFVATGHLNGTGIHAAAEISRIPTRWFEGPVIPQPASQAKEDYPLDYANALEIAADAPLGFHYWKASTSQGVTASLPFIVGDLPEVVEDEIPGVPAPVDVPLPITANGRIFPREDVDLWRFTAQAGQVITCAVDASRLHSPLEARLELYGPDGRSIGESLSIPGADARLRFTAPDTGQYTVKIHDIQFGGLQDYVYRLTITAGPRVDYVYPLGGRRGSVVTLELSGANLAASQATITLPITPDSDIAYRLETLESHPSDVTLELDDLPEFLEPAAGATATCVTFPANLNGRILQAGEVDEWSFEAKSGDEFDFDVRAARLGSLLDAVLQIVDAQQKILLENDDQSTGQTDSRLRFRAPADGHYLVRLSDRLPDRGGPQFAYRIRGITTARPEFELRLATDTVAIERGKPAPLKVVVKRGPGLIAEIALRFDGLPAGVTVTPMSIKPDQQEVVLTFLAAETAQVQAVPLTITGQITLADRSLVQAVKIIDRAGIDRPDPLWLAVALPTPFRFTGIFETKFMPRGSQYVRHYAIQRNGFEGPLEARLADQQGRHLQGVTGGPVAISPGQSEFDFAVKLPPFMEIGRTSRTTLSVLGEVTDFDGSRHVVSYSSNAQNDQMIALVDPGRLAITPQRRTLSVVPGQNVKLAFRLQRSVGLNHLTQVEIVIPEGLRGVTSQPVIIGPAEQSGELELHFATDATGPFLTPLTIRATTMDDRMLSVIHEATLELVAGSAIR